MAEAQGMWGQIQSALGSMLEAKQTPAGQPLPYATAQSQPYLAAIQAERAKRLAAAQNATGSPMVQNEGALLGFGAGSRAAALEDLVKQTKGP